MEINKSDHEITSQINVAAYFLAQENHTYDKLCWMLAKRRLRAQKDARYNEESVIREIAAGIYFSSTPYDILCWLVAELDTLIRLGVV